MRSIFLSTILVLLALPLLAGCIFEERSRPGRDTVVVREDAPPPDVIVVEKEVPAEPD